VAWLYRDLPALIQELGDLDNALGLVPDVDDDFRRGDLQDGSLHHFAFRYVAEAAIVDIKKSGVLVGRDILIGRIARRPFRSLDWCGFGLAISTSTFGDRGGPCVRTLCVLVVSVRHALRVL